MESCSRLLAGFDGNVDEKYQETQNAKLRASTAPQDPDPAPPPTKHPVPFGET